MKVAIVGGGPSAIVYPHGDEIDSSDVVVRVNYYEIKGYESCVGTRTDIWVTGDLEPTGNMKSILTGWTPEGIKSFRHVWLYPRKTWWTGYGPGLKRVLNLRPDLEPMMTEMELVEYTNKECGNEGTDIATGRPSSGTMAVFLVFRRLKPTEVLLVGFDAVFKDDAAYMGYYEALGRKIYRKDSVRQSGHHYDRERALILKTASESGMEAIEQHGGIVRFRERGLSK